MYVNPGIGYDDEFSRDERVRKYTNYLSEVEMLGHNNYKHVGKMVEAFRNIDGELFIIMEYFENGNLLEKRKKETTHRDRPYYTEKEVIDIFRQICKGLSYIHGKGAAHRDLDPRNIMNTKDGRIKIVDFGLASHLNSATE